MMDNEREPLLKVSYSGKTSETGISEESLESVSVSVKPSFRIPMYGTNSKPIGKIIPANKKITYTWSNLNVFSNRDQQLSNQRLCFCFNRKSSGGGGGGGANVLLNKHILKNVSGVARPGELLAILGSSGAGKTTLLNALTFRSTRNVTVTGFRCVNSVPVTSTSLTSHSAYVQQNDLFIGSLTVKEHLVFQALVRMDRNISYHQRMQRVEDVIAELSLTKCQYTQIGIPGRVKGISGGEKKRLSFAAEVLTNPSLMFCDEPTSGLDSFMALNVIQVLKGLAKSGRTIVCTIHQPSSELYAMFDKLLLMAEGRIAFLGTPEEADVFFTDLKAPCPKNYNPADYFIQLLAIVPDNEESSRQAVANICDKYEQSDIGAKIFAEAAVMANESGYDNYHYYCANSDDYKNPYKASWCAQFRAVLWRSWLSVIKEPLLIKVRLLQTIIISLLLGTIYYGQELNQDGVMNINGALFIFLTNMTFQNVYAVINVFCSEMPIFLREHRNGMYRTDVYFLCKTIAESPMFIVIPLIFTGVSYFLIGLNPNVTHFLMACGILTLVSNVATSFGYMISCVSSSISMALSIGPPLIIPFMLFGGFFLNISSIPGYFKWLSYLSWFRFANEALMINQWNDVDSIDCPISNATCPRDGRVVLEIYNFTESDFLMDIVCLAALIVGFRLLAFFALLIKTYRYE